MKKYAIIICNLVALLILAGLSSVPVSAQKQNARTFAFKFTVEDVSGKPLSNAVLYTEGGTLQWHADKDGVISAKARPKEILIIEAEGFDQKIFNITRNNIPETITMYRTPARTNTSGSSAAVSSIKGSELESFPELVFSNILQGRIPGLQVMMTASGLGNNIPDVYIRGNHGNENNGAIFIIDGLERAIADIVPEEIEKVEVMKDALAKIIYGPRAANGVLYITTKRGVANTRVIRATVESGVNIGTRIPEYLDSYEYATLYNEARANDGLMPFYSPEQLEGYRNSSGPNDLLHPNVDWYDTFTRNVSTYQNASFDMNGGSEKLKYSVVMNYKRGTGFEKIGQIPALDRFNIRGNIDVKVTDYLSVFADAASRLEIRKWGQQNMAGVYGALSTNRPNEYPLMISPDVIGIEANEDGVPFFGASMLSADNLLADMQYGGFNSERYISSMVNLGLDFDFNDYVEGLGAKASLMFDNYSYFGQGQTNTYPTYAIRGTNPDELDFVQRRKEALQANQSRTSDNFNQTLGYYAKLYYSRLFGMHDVSTELSYDYYKNEVNGVGQDNINENLYLKAAYGYGQRYFIDAVGALMGSNRYAVGNRHFLSYAVGASWIITNEEFMKSQDFVDFLKIKASYGKLGFDRNTSYLLYKTAWNNGGNISLGEQNKGTVERTTSFIRFAKDLRWEHSCEFNVGFVAAFLDGRLTAGADYFNEVRKDIVASQSASLQAIHGGFITVDNIGSVQNYGVDGYIRWSDKVDQFSYDLGMNVTWSKNKLLAWNQIDYPDKGHVSVGKPTDAIFGYTATGLFGKDVKLDGSSTQTFGDYGIGSVAYEDTNDDGVVDSRDRVMIGNRFPRTTLGIDVRLGYKGWEVFACGTAQLGKWYLKDNTFWQADMEDKYSVVVRDRFHPENNPDGTYPALSTRSASNNFVNSTFWLENASFFRLKNAELSYTFTFPDFGIKKLRIFARGTNLFVLSDAKYLDPETVNAGVTTYPLFRTITGGLSITF